MTIQVNVHEAKTNLSKLLQAVERGEKVVIAKNGKPVAEVIAAKPNIDPSAFSFLGWMRGDGMVPENFDTFKQDEIVELFEGAPDKFS